jgi:putative membrane protein
VLVALGLMAALFLAHLYYQAEPALTSGSADPHNVSAIAILGVLFCAIDARLLLGWRRALVLAGLSVLVGWTVEHLGVEHGLIFGRYSYTDCPAPGCLGPKLGGVPLVVPLFWFVEVYLAYVITNLITRDRPDLAGDTTIPQDLWYAVLGGLVATAYDLGLDPLMVKNGAWTWYGVDPQQSYFGIPVSNYYGWIAVVMLISLVMRRLDHRLAVKRRATGLPLPSSHLIHFAERPWFAKAISAVPVVFYFSYWISHLSGENFEPPVIVISLIALGIPAMAAVSNWRRWQVGERVAGE